MRVTRVARLDRVNRRARLRGGRLSPDRREELGARHPVERPQAFHFEHRLTQIAIIRKRKFNHLAEPFIEEELIPGDELPFLHPGIPG